MWNASAGELSAVEQIKRSLGKTGSPSRPFSSRRKVRLKKGPAVPSSVVDLSPQCGDQRAGTVGETTLKSIERGHRPPDCSAAYKSKHSRVNKKRNCGRSLTPKTSMQRCVADLIKVLNQSNPFYYNIYVYIRNLIQQNILSLYRFRSFTFTFIKCLRLNNVFFFVDAENLSFLIFLKIQIH